MQGDEGCVVIDLGYARFLLPAFLDVSKTINFYNNSGITGISWLVLSHINSWTHPPHFSSQSNVSRFNDVC